jgi:hypothetical protein
VLSGIKIHAKILPICIYKITRTGAFIMAVIKTRLFDALDNHYKIRFLLLFYRASLVITILLISGLRIFVFYEKNPFFGK